MTDSIDSDLKVLANDIKYVKATLDELRKDHLPVLRKEVKQTISDEFIPLELRVHELEIEMRMIDKRVWAMFGAAGLVVPTLVSALITMSIAYFAGRF